jgi:hypothetical protein
MRRSFLLLSVALALLFFGPIVGRSIATEGTAVKKIPPPELAFPQILPLPVGFRPEGIAIGRGTEFFVSGLGNFAQDGETIVGAAIYRGDLRTGQGEVIAELPDGQMAVGIKLDERTDYLFVAGGLAKNVVVYDVQAREKIATFPLIDAGFANDLFVTRDAVYVTDSFSSFLFRIPLRPGGGLPPQGPIEGFTMSGDYAVGDMSYPFQANGIVATPNDRWLIVVNSNSGLLYRVNPATGLAKQIDLGGKTIPFGDGLVLDGRMLYVVQNFPNKISAVWLNPDLLSGTIVDDITSPYLAIPTTAASFGNALYVVNARFVESEPLNPESPDIPYEVVRVEK